MIAWVLIDNGSSLNVLPKATLDKLTPVDALLKASSVVVGAFDGSKWEVMGEISLPILIGHGHSASLQLPFGATLDTRCQSRAFFPTPTREVLNNHQIISVMGEKELVITTPAPEGYIEEVKGTKKGKPEDTTSPQANTALQIMIKGGYQPGKGLGPHLEGTPAPIQVLENLGRFGVNYQESDSKVVVRGQSFVRGSVSVIGEETGNQAGWV
ncbi:hypothetical protein CR513_55321, partial [Mucuna pruriens]